jgi:serine/threonine-protein kinase
LRLVIRETLPQTSDDIALVTLASRNGARTAQASAVTPLLRSRFAENNADISPGGRWLAYQSNESGAYEIYVRPFPNVDAGRTLVSDGGGTRPVWARDGHELFYMSGASPDPIRLMRVTVQTGDTFSAGTPERLFEGRYFASTSPGARGRTYDVMPDGKRFVIVKDAAPASAPSSAAPFSVVLNFFDELRRVAPGK